VDLPSLVSELHLRGFDQNKVDSALRCLVHVHAVQDFGAGEAGGILAEDILNSYELDVVQAGTQLFLEKSMVEGREVFRVKWGCEAAAETMEDQLWSHVSERWEEFVSQLDERYLGLFMPSAQTGRVINDWKLGKELRWFSVEVPRQGWKILGMIEDISEVAWKLDLAFGYRSLGTEGVQGPRVLLHSKAYRVLKTRRVDPPPELIGFVRLWRFFSEYDVHSTDFVALMRECGLTLEEIVEQVNKFFSSDLTSQYREGQYPPYFINDKKKKEFQQAVRDLLSPMDAWLLRKEPAEAVARSLPGRPEWNPKRMLGHRSSSPQ
jgi:DNA-binding transcriptional MerR regulator